MTPAALRKLLEEATPGPWGEGLGGNPIYPRFDNGQTETVYPVATSVGSTEEWKEAIWVLRRRPDAALIVAAVNALPALLDVAEWAAEARIALQGHRIDDRPYTEYVADVMLRGSAALAALQEHPLTRALPSASPGATPTEEET